MSFDAHEEKIRKIFAGDAKFEIPRNQRKYVWKEKQWKELLGDILYIRNKQHILLVLHGLLDIIIRLHILIQPVKE